VLFDVVAPLRTVATARSTRAGLAHRLQLLIEELALIADAFEQAAALDGQVNQLLDSLRAAPFRWRRSSPNSAMLAAKSGQLLASVRSGGRQ
jgi:hypothetical protein